MKVLTRCSLLILLLTGFIIILHSCKKEELPTLSTSTATNITATSASCGGNIASDGGAEVTEKGVCWGTNENPTISDLKTTDGNGAGQFVSEITGLTAGTLYHVRAYATNSVGTAYGADLSFTTLGQAPEAITQTATNITTNEATLNGTVNANDLSTTVTFEYGTTTAYGNSIPASSSPVEGNSITNVCANIADLNPGTVYHCRIKTVNTLGTSFGSDVEFTTLGQAPMIISPTANQLTGSSAILNATINPNWLDTHVTFEYGPTRSYGFNVAAQQNPLTGSANTVANSIIIDLAPETSYHFRVVAMNSFGTTFGDDITFITLASNQISDIDGNKYTTTQIGSQEWIAKDLSVTRLNDGTNIPYAESDAEWSVNSPVMCYHNGIPLYNWYVVGTNKICPIGWHVPTDDDWIILEEYIGIYNGHMLKSDKGEWDQDITDDFNKYNFNAIPTDLRYYNGQYDLNDPFQVAVYWSSSIDSTVMLPIYRALHNNSNSIQKYRHSYNMGYAIRCIKDN